MENSSTLFRLMTCLESCLWECLFECVFVRAIVHLYVSVPICGMYCSENDDVLPAQTL